MSPYFGTRDLNNGVVTPEPLTMTYPDIPATKMDRAGSVDDFSTLVLRGMKIYQERFLKRDKKTWVPLVMGYPMTSPNDSSRIDFKDIKTLDDYYFLHPFCDLVTFTLRYQAPAGYKKAFGTEKIRASLWKENLYSHNHPGVAYGVHTNEMDNLVQFDCWSSTGRGADLLADWFKQFMEFFKGSIMKQGFQKIQFWERGIDKDITKWRDDISVRSLQYLVKTEEFYTIPQKLISGIDLELSVERSLNEEEDLFIHSVTGVDPSGLTDDVDLAPIISGVNSLSTSTLVES